MNRLSKYSAVVVFSFAFLFSFCQTTTEREKGWRDDIDYLLAMVKKFHYVYSREPLPQQMIDLTNKIKSSISEYSDERMLIELERIMFYLGDGHSYILPVGSKIKAHCVPLKFYQFSDGLFVIDAYSEFKHLIGYKIIQAGPVEPKTFMSDMESYVSQDNKIGALWFGPYFFRVRGMFVAYGLQ